MASKNTLHIHVKKYTKEVSVAMNRQIQMRLHADSFHSQEQGPLKPVSKSI
jgi:hypothetical protein